MADKLAPLRVIVVGASYGMLLAMRLAVAGVCVAVVGRPEEVDAIRASGGPRLRIPAREDAQLLEVTEADVTGGLTLANPEMVDLGACDLVFLAASEPQYRGQGLRGLMERVAQRRLPCVSLMNVPPLAFLRRLPSLDVETLEGVHASRDVWDLFAPESMTASSPDPQSIRPDPSRPELSEVTLPTNFKVAPFAHLEHQSLIETLAAAIDRSEVVRDGARYHLRVRLKAEQSVYTPLAKWPMLIVGNCRCVTDVEPISIRDAVHSDLAASRELYDWVQLQCLRFGADKGVMVPFDQYAKAALALSRPSSLARALHAGAREVERPDRLVQQLAHSFRQSHDALESIVTRIDQRLTSNAMQRRPETATRRQE